MKTKKSRAKGTLQWFVHGDNQTPTTIVLENKRGQKIGELIPEQVIGDPKRPKKEQLILEIDIEPAFEELERKKLMRRTVGYRDCFD